MIFNRLSRRHFARIAGWSALGISSEIRRNPLRRLEQRKRPPDRSLPSSFPGGFLWGTATSAYQIEGAVNEDERGPSIWDRYAHTRGKILDQSTADVANDHYHLLQGGRSTDQGAGCKGLSIFDCVASRFSGRSGSPNPKGLDFYNRLLDELLANGIEPFATLVSLGSASGASGSPRRLGVA